MPKTRLSSRIKIAFLNVMQALGSAASHMASNAKLRVAEINLQSRRHEILTEFSLQAFELWHNGVKLPKELSDMFKELSEIDDKLSILRAQKYAKVKAEVDECETIVEAETMDGDSKVVQFCAPQPPQEDAAADAKQDAPKKAAKGGHKSS